jgi:hypothetical protein
VGKAGSPSGRCRTCAHAERGRIDYLIATGAALEPLAERFGLSRDTVWRHAKHHVSPEYRAAVRIGPFESEERLRALCAEGGTSVLEHLRAVYSPLAARYLVAFEAGADGTLSNLAGRLHQNLEIQARLTKELMPAPSSLTINGVFLGGGDWFGEFSADLLALVRRHPAIKDDLAALLRRRLGGPAPDVEVIEHQPGAAHA